MDLQIYSGECFGLLGHNGSGKSTIINMIAGLIKPDEGQILIKKGLITQVCLQHDYLFNELTVSDHIYFSKKLIGATDEQEI